MSEQTRKTFWLSFADDERFAGVAVVDVCRDEQGADTPFIAAIKKSIKLKANPGPDYAVQGQELPPDAIPEQFKHRLLGEAEVDLLNLRTQ
jgi:hypothetical protein